MSCNKSINILKHLDQNEKKDGKPDRRLIGSFSYLTHNALGEVQKDYF